MSKNVKLNNNDYFGVSTVQIPTQSGGVAQFKDMDEIVTPSGDKAISANGTYDISAFARAIVNVPTEGASAVLQTKTVTITENGTRQIKPDAGNDGMTSVTVNVNVPVSGAGPGNAGNAGSSIETGHVVLDADQTSLKVTGLGFSPKAFAIIPTVTLQNSSCGAFFVNGVGAILRTGTNNTTVGAMGLVLQLGQITKYPDDSTVSIGATFQAAAKILETGFAVGAYNATFPFRAGMEFDWCAIG